MADAGNADIGRARWIALRRAGLGSESFGSLIRHFGGIAEAWDAPDGEARRAGLRTQYVRAFERARRTFDPEGETAALAEHGVRVITWEDAEYPDLLKEIPSSPPVLFARGSAGPRFAQALAVVGTRDATPYGREACEQLCGAAARAGVAIVSGLARGIDAIAHRAALEAGAPTVAVLGGGIDAIYPRENAGLAERIMANGCLLSEYPVGSKARPDHFPRRNRIISGLAQATLVVEAGKTSGALITADHALEQNREVLAVPGDIFAPRSAGVNRRIRESGAKLVGSAEDLLEELNLLSVGAQPPLAEPPPPLAVVPQAVAEVPAPAAAPPAPDAPAPVAPTASAPVAPAAPAPVAPVEPAAAAEPALADDNEGRVLRCLEHGPLHVDEVARLAELPIQAVTGALLTLELRGLVRQQEPMTYRRAP